MKMYISAHKPSRNMPKVLSRIVRHLRCRVETLEPIL